MPTDSTLLNNSVARYLNYAKDIKIQINGFPVNLDYSASTCNLIEHIFNNTLTNFYTLVEVLSKQFPKNKLNFYSLQNPYLNSKSSDVNKTPRKYWQEKTLEILFENGKGDKENGGLFFFLFDSCSGNNIKSSEAFFDNKNSTDEQFCHSLLLRDFVKVNKIGFEYDLSIDTKIENDDKTDVSYLEYKISRLDKNSKVFYNKVNSIIRGFNNYFSLKNSNRLKKDDYCEYITDFYAYNLNCKAFKYANVDDIIVDGIKLSEVDSGHDLYGSVLNEMKKEDKTVIKDIDKLSKWYIYVNILSSFTKTLIYYQPISENKPEILLIDDHPDKINKEIAIIEKWIGSGSIFNKKNKDLPFDKFDKLFDAIENRKLSSDSSVDRILKKIIDIENTDKQKTKKYDFILIDLDYDGELKGFEYLRKLRKAKTIYSKPYVIVFSRNEDPKSVQKALNMGALFVASKQNVANLILELYKVLPLVYKTEDKNKDYSLGHNWSLLYQLPLNKILSLKSESEKIKGESYQPYEQGKEDYGFDKKKLKTDKEYLWINKLPKAELHCHIGSVLGPDLIPQTSLLILAQKYKYRSNNIRHIIEFILPIVTDPFLFEELDDILEEKVEFFNDFLDYTNSEWYNLKNSIIIDTSNQFKHQSIFTIISDSLNLKAFKNKTPEEVLLSPEDETLEKQFIPFSRLKSSDYYKSKLKLRELGIKYDEVMLFFILILDLREKETEKENRKGFEKSLEDNIIEMAEVIDKSGNENFNFPSNEVESFKNTLTDEFKQLSDKLFIPFYKYKSKSSKESKSILEFLISAHSNRRCLDFHNRGLFYYLRGCEYGGTPHLQSRESVFLVAHHIIYNYAIPDNIRYLDLRCSIDGYNKFKLFKQSEDDTKDPVSKIIVDSLKESFTYWQRKAFSESKIKTHVNLIITAKRHKSIKEFEENVLITVENYKHPDDEEISNIKSFFETKTEVVSFDIAGLEKGNRVSRFKEKLEPLLEKCIPINMHAGEEDSHEAIWEAHYLAHAQRIGHALTLKDNEKLINSIREAFVNIELCPISNYLTNNNYSFNSSAIKNKYPLKDYLTKRISVSINTDNPYVSNSNLTKEFLFAAQISGGLTRWEILKIILYSFKSITIHKSLKTKLLKEINEEIYELLLNEGE